MVNRLWAVVLGSIATAAALQERESILDRKVHIEEGLVTEIPAAPRWCDRLELRQRRVKVKDAELFVEEEGSGPAVVLLHGGPGATHHGFHPWFGKAAKFARIIYYDQRGCGQSDYAPGPDGYNVDQAAADLDALREALGLERWVVLGHSYGGFLAQHYTTLYPERVAGLVLVGAQPGINANLGRSRQYQFISNEEITKIREVGRQLNELAKQKSWTRQEALALLVYNNHINGDWKRQHFYRPGPEQMAQIARYEWVQDAPFNSVMSQSARRVDLTGAFRRNPIPTLILEGIWDLTWGPEKRVALASNHPNGRLVTFDSAGHSIYDEDPDRFFAELEAFVAGLAPVGAAAFAQYADDLARRRDSLRALPSYHLRGASWGKGGSVRIAKAFRPEWIEGIDDPTDLLRLGFALYDVERYDEGVRIFERLESVVDSQSTHRAVALIWQGHLLDLLGKRAEAVAKYRRVVALGIKGETSHDQYGLAYQFVAYATERIRTAFQRIENRSR